MNATFYYQLGNRDAQERGRPLVPLMASRAERRQYEHGYAAGLRSLTPAQLRAGRATYVHGTKYPYQYAS